MKRKESEEVDIQRQDNNIINDGKTAKKRRRRKRKRNKNKNKNKNKTDTNSFLEDDDNESVDDDVETVQPPKTKYVILRTIISLNKQNKNYETGKEN